MNVQQTIIKGIKEQLFFHNYLVLPGFGGFVLKSQYSHFSQSGSLLMPPSKTISFNSQLKQNDGVLALWIQNKLSCTGNEAISHLADFTEYCSSILNSKRRLSIEGIGFFYLDFENNICFEPQGDSNFLSASFGLSPVSLKPLDIPVKEIKKETVFVDRTLSTASPSMSEQNVRFKMRKVVTPALLSGILILFLSLLLMNRQISGELHSSLLNENAHSSYSEINYSKLELEPASTNEKAYVTDANGIAIIKLSEDKSLAVKVIEAGDHSSLSSGNKYEVVLGCFSILENAEKLITKLSSQKVKAFVAGKNNKDMYIVSNGIFNNKADAAKHLHALKSRFPKAWLRTQN